MNNSEQAPDHEARSPRVLLIGPSITVLASDDASQIGLLPPDNLAAAAASILSGGGGVAEGWDLVPMFLPEGNGVFCVRHGNEDESKTGHDSFIRVIENNPFGIYLVDSDFRLAKVSVGAQKVFENVRPLIGRDFAEVMRIVWPDTFANEAIAIFRHTLETGEPYHSRDTKEKRGDIGALEAYDWKIERVSLPKGKYGVVCYFYDLTEQMKLRNDIEFLADFVDQLRHGATEEVVYREATESVRGYFDASLCCIAEFDPKTGEPLNVFCDPSFTEDSPFVLNTTLSSGITWVCADTVLVPEISNASKTYGIRSMVAVPQIREDNCISTFVVCTDIPRIWEKREIALIENLADRLWTTVSGLRLDERVRATQRLESIGLLAGGIAHDFNNLLTGILGASDIAQQDIDDKNPLKPYLETISKAGERAADLTSQLLAYAGKSRAVVEPMNLTDFITGTNQFLRISMPRNVTLDLDLDPDLPDILADRGQMQQVLMNLAINAAESIPDGATGGVKVSAKLTEVVAEDRISKTSLVRIEPGRYVALSVVDNGAGMDAETQSKIFDPFYTTKFMGRGLGLAAVLGIVSAHKGGIVIESEPAVGTTFTVLFPALPNAAKAAAPDLPALTQATGSRVLVVDDEDVVREFAMTALSGAGYSVMPAADGKECVDVFRQQPDAIDLVLLDMTMPVLDGEGAFEALRMIRPDVPIVVMSGYSDTEATDRFAGKGMNGFLRKPFTVAGLRRAIQQGLSAQD